MNITPRMLEKPDFFGIVGKNVNPKNLRQISETELARLTQKAAMVAISSEQRAKMISEAVETFNPQLGQS